MAAEVFAPHAVPAPVPAPVPVLLLQDQRAASTALSVVLFCGGTAGTFLGGVALDRLRRRGALFCAPKPGAEREAAAVRPHWIPLLPLLRPWLAWSAPPTADLPLILDFMSPAIGLSLTLLLLVPAAAVLGLGPYLVALSLGAVVSTSTIAPYQVGGEEERWGGRHWPVSTSTIVPCQVGGEEKQWGGEALVCLDEHRGHHACPLSSPRAGCGHGCGRSCASTPPLRPVAPGSTPHSSPAPALVLLRLLQAERPLALGLGQLIIHVLGDVPFPPLIGWTLDALAPAVCSGSGGSGPAGNGTSVASEGGGGGGAAEECARASSGVRWVIFLAHGWQARMGGWEGRRTSMRGTRAGRARGTHSLPRLPPDSRTVLADAAVGHVHVLCTAPARYGCKSRGSSSSGSSGCPGTRLAL